MWDLPPFVGAIIWKWNNIHETSRRRARKRMGALRWRAKTPFQKHCTSTPYSKLGFKKSADETWVLTDIHTLATTFFFGVGNPIVRHDLHLIVSWVLNTSCKGCCWHINILFLYSQNLIKIFCIFWSSKICWEYSVCCWFFWLKL